MNTYQVLLMRPLWLLEIHSDFSDLSDLQYMAADVQATNDMLAFRTALDELYKCDRKAGLKTKQSSEDYTVLGFFCDGRWTPCFNQPAWKGH